MPNLNKYIDRYNAFKSEFSGKQIPFIPILKSDTDEYIKYDINKDRFDRLSSRFYGTPLFSWIILQANPEYGYNEFLIPDKVQLRIPLPIEAVLEDYLTNLNFIIKGG